MKATSLLEKQHNRVTAIFKKLEGQRGDSATLLEELANSLAAHMAIEAAELESMGKEMAQVFEKKKEQGYEALLLKGNKTPADVASSRMLSSRPQAAE